MTTSHVSPFLRDKITGVVVRTDEGYFCLDPDEQFVSRALLASGAYGLGEVARARQFLTGDSRVLVVGAHIGTIAVPLSRSCRELGSEYFASLGMQRILASAATLIVEFVPHHLSRVAGVTVERFLQPLASHFRTLQVPSTREEVGAEGFGFVLEGMFDENQGDAGVIFRK